jgi:membrane-associated phospholipid phosphatase
VPPPPSGPEPFAAAPGPAPEQVSFWTDHPIDRWFDQAFLAVESQEPKDPPRASRAYAYLSVAIHDAVVAAWYWKGVYRRPLARAPSRFAASEGPYSYPSAVAAVATASAAVLAFLFPDIPSDQYQLLAEQCVRARIAAGASRPSDVAAGAALGRSVGALVVARASRDGADAVWRGGAPTGPNQWAPPPGLDEAPVEPLAGTWRTWFLRSGSELRPGPPPAFGSAQMLREAREVVRVSGHLTDAQRALAEFWRGGQGTAQAPGLWDQVAIRLADAAGTDLPAEAELLAVLNMAMADVAIAVWDCKYHYWSPRPVNVIQDLGIAPGWAPLLPTPAFPSYVSGHSAFSAAAAVILARFFPRSADALHAWAWQAAMSRLYGGIHFRSDIDAGFSMGAAVGARALRWLAGDPLAATAPRSPPGGS